MNHMHQAFAPGPDRWNCLQIQKIPGCHGDLEEPQGERKDWWLMRHRAVEVEEIAQ